MSIRIQCPNPGCRKVYSVQSRFAGKRGKCPDCGVVMTIPAAAAKPHTSRATNTRAEVDPWGDPALEGHPGLPDVRVGCVGRGHAGKTALFHALGESVVGEFLPSGLHVDADDPRAVARMIREAEATQRFLQQSGLPPTLQASQIRYAIYDGDEPRVVYRMREVIGQILTHTLPDSTRELQARYDQYLKSLVNTHVLWAVVPCPPPDAGSRDRRRYANDLRITMAYLREALRLRPAAQPAVVALVMSKIDSLFEDPEEARTELTDEVLRSALGPLVQLVEKSARVSDAAIVPVTAFGFGNAVLHESDRREGTPPESDDEPFGSEPVWLLRDGVSPRPYNLDTLFLWTLLMGLLTQEEAHHEATGDLTGLTRRLGEDLEACDPWLIQIKGGVVLPSAEGHPAPSGR